VPKREPCFAYLRTSSAANIDGDSPTRQSATITAFAKSAGLEVTACFYDAAVSGADAIEDRPGFNALLTAIESNGVRTMVCEDASRFARSVIAQELGVLALIKRGVKVFTASGEDLTATDDPARVMMRQVAGSFAEYERTRLVAKLKAARDRKRAETGRCEGRKPPPPELVKEAKRLRRRSPRTGKRRSLRTVARELAAVGFNSPTGKPYSAEGIKQLLTRQ
jgi:DNA invertase Pin-like site-specific DNA recombinase